MSIFGFFFVSGLLREVGWPRKQGLFQKEVIDTTILEQAVNQMVDWSAALGAGRPRLALQILAEMFRDRDWEGEDTPRIKSFIDEAQSDWGTAGNAAPHEIVRPTPLFAKHYGRSMALKDFTDARTRTFMEHFCLEGLLWGLGNPDRFEAWYRSMTQHHESRLPLMRQAGLAVDALPEMSQFLVDSEEVLRNYEREVSPLPPVPERLLADARALGRELDP